MMDDCDDNSDYDDYDSGGDVSDEADDIYDDSYSEEDDGGGDPDEEEEEEEDEHELEEEGGQDEEGELEDGMEDYEEETSETGEEHNDDEEEIVEYDGVVIEGEDDDEEENQAEYEDEEQELMEEEEEDEEELLEEDEDGEEGDEGEVYSDEDEIFEDEEEVNGDEDEVYEYETDYEDEIAAPEPLYVPRPTVLAPLLGELPDSGGHGRGLGRYGSDWRLYGPRSGMALSGPTDDNVIPSDRNVVDSGGTQISGRNESSAAGLEGAICPICFESWTGEGPHCVCCLPCGHLYGLSCITMWLQRSNSQKCPQCNEICQLEDVRRLYGMQPAISGAEALQQKVKRLEEKCASLELKDADWLRKETEWQKREADLQEQLNQHKEAGSMKHAIPGNTKERPDLGDNPEPTNEFQQMKL